MATEPVENNECHTFSPGMKTLEIIVAGRVQGVGYRVCVRRQASSLSVTGKVMNLGDGRVRIFATAEPMILEKFVSSLYGCPRAVVRDIEIHDHEQTRYNDFSIVRS